MGFSDNLRKMRKMNGWTQAELGEKCGINPKTLSSYESGRTEPNLGEVIKLCSIFDCSISFLTGTKERENESITVEDILFRLNSLDRNSLERIESTIKQIIQKQLQHEAMVQEQKMLENQIRDYEKRLAELSKKLEGDD